MRAIVPARLAAIALAGAATTFAPAPALAAASPTPAPSRTAHTDVCLIDDPRATELSGLVATPNGYLVINDSRSNPDEMQVFRLDLQCRVVSTLSYPTPARDPEDLAVAPDGTIWVADIGDNATAQTRRETIALWLISSDFTDLAIHRLVYPDGPHDAEALLFAGDGTPIIVTKEASGVAGLYQPAERLLRDIEAGVPMRRVGEFRPTATGEPNVLGSIGEVLVTGAAVTPDRRRVALRTLTAAYEWDVVGDVVTTITTTTPRVTLLPGEPQGEAISYTIDGSAFLTVSDEEGPTTLRRYERTLPTAPARGPAGPTGVALWLILAVGVVAIGIVIAGILGLRRARSSGAEPPG